MIVFYGHTNTSGKINKTCFSNFYPAEFIYRGLKFPTAEHALMASKALVFWDLLRFELISKADTPASAKSYGRRIYCYNDAIWSAVRYQIMVDILLAKFGQNPELKEYLLSTGDEILVEAAPNDCVWGVGLKADDPRINDPIQWLGTNLLGNALMEVRRML